MILITHYRTIMAHITIGDPYFLVLTELSARQLEAMELGWMLFVDDIMKQVFVYRLNGDITKTAFTMSVWHTHSKGSPSECTCHMKN